MKPLASVSSFVDAGNDVVLATGISLIRNIQAGEKIFLKRERGEGVSVDSVGVIGTDSREGSGFVRQAHPLGGGC